MLFCVECGREGPTVEGLCPACFRAKRPLVRPPETIDAVVCKECGRVETAGGWARVPLESAIPRILQERVPVDPRAARPAFSYSMAREDPRNYRLTVKVAARIQDVEVVESFTTRLRVKQGQCPTCTRRRSRYYEGIVQLRAEGRALTDAERGRLVRFVEEAVERRAAKGEEAFVSKVEVVRGGVHGPHQHLLAAAAGGDDAGADFDQADVALGGGMNAGGMQRRLAAAAERHPEGCGDNRPGRVLDGHVDALEGSHGKINFIPVAFLGGDEQEHEVGADGEVRRLVPDDQPAEIFFQLFKTGVQNMNNVRADGVHLGVILDARHPIAQVDQTGAGIALDDRPRFLFKVFENKNARALFEPAVPVGNEIKKGSAAALAAIETFCAA